MLPQVLLLPSLRLLLPLVTVPLAASPARSVPCATAIASLGPEDAPLSVEVFADPAAPETLLLWMELLRLVGEQEGRVRVQVVWARTPMRNDGPRVELVRSFVLAAQTRGLLLPALRVVAREGVERTFARLVRADTRTQLWQDVGLANPPALHSGSEHTPVFQSELRCAAAEVLERIREDHSIIYRLPVFTLDGEVFEDAEGLVRLRPLLAAAQRVERTTSDAVASPALPPAEALPALAGGVTLGGIGLPHRFLLVAQDEDDPNLFLLLPLLLEFRHAHPGQMSVQVVARGAALGAKTLRQRLCAARKLGREIDYIRYLGSGPLQHNHPSEFNRALLEALDGVAAPKCAADLDPAEANVPAGAWLDGRPQTRSDLEGLDELMLGHRRGGSGGPLSSLLRPRKRTQQKRRTARDGE